MSNRERIARAAEEARLAEAEKAQKRSAKKGSGSRSKRPGTPVRMKVVWEVCDGAGRMVRCYSYPDKAEAEAQTKALTDSTGRAHSLRANKVPME